MLIQQLDSPNSGSISVTDVIVTYNGKTNSEFLNCSGISTVVLGENVTSTDYVTYGFAADGNRIDVRVTGVLEKVIVEDNTNYHSVEDPILIQSLGFIKDKKDSKFNSWKFNTSTKFNANSIAWNGQYFVVETYDEHNLFVNDDIQFVNKIDNSIVSGRVRKILSDRRIQVSANLDRNLLNLQNLYFIRRSLKVSQTSITQNSF